MNNIKKILFLFLFATLQNSNLFAKTGPSQIKKDDPNIIQISMNESDAKKIRTEEVRSGLIFNEFLNNELPLGKGKIYTHGNLSARLSKKSFKIELIKHGVNFENDSLKTFFAIGMAEDPYYVNNYFSYSLAKKLDLFHSDFFYSKISINQKENGLYLLIERPEDALRRSFPEILGIARRRFKNNVDVKYKKNPLGSNAVSSFIKSIDKIPKKKISPNEKILELQKFMNLELYLKWLALNRLLMNGDYTDEIFFVVTHKNDHFYASAISAWDFDDIIQGPHNGSGIVYRTGIMSLVYSGETALDVFIAKNPKLYKMYLKSLDLVLQEISPEVIINHLNLTKTIVAPYLTAEEFKMTEAHLTFLKDKLIKNHEFLKNEIVRHNL